MTMARLSGRYFNPRSPRGERRMIPYGIGANVDFNPRSPRGERQMPAITLAGTIQFQPTLPSRGATPSTTRVFSTIVISTHAPLAGSDMLSGRLLMINSIISTHAPLAGSDQSCHSHLCCRVYFNPRSPRGERPRRTSWPESRGYFNPRSPRGERPTCRRSSTVSPKFQPTLPSRGATLIEVTFTGAVGISTHAPLAGSDGRRQHHPPVHLGFQPTLPSRGATPTFSTLKNARTYFNPRSPRGERLARIAAQV